MLVASDAAGRRKVASSDVSGSKFQCPDCGAPVAMRVSASRVAHFAHFAGKACNSERVRRERKRDAALRRIARAEAKKQANGQRALFDLEELVH